MAVTKMSVHALAVRHVGERACAVRDAPRLSDGLLCQTEHGSDELCRPMLACYYGR